MNAATLRTERLLLRAWKPKDLEPFAALNADRVVMEHFQSTMSRDKSAAMIRTTEATFAARGYGLWAVEIPGAAPFIGFVGLWLPTFESHFTPAVELGWRLAKEHWGHGYATEGARAAARFGFEAGLDEIVACTVPANTRSIRVMKKLGMTHDAVDDFDHPKIPEGDPLRRHVLYRLRPDQLA